MSLHTALVKIEEEKISSEKAKKFIASEKNGAESIFIGRVRNENSGKKVTAVTYDAHDQAVLKSFQSICNNAKNKFDKNAKIFLEHAQGYAPVGEISILIAVGSGHRDEAFKICRYILEEVKTSVSYMEKRALYRWERRMASRTFTKTQKRNKIK